MVVSAPTAGKRRRLPGLAVRPGSIRQARAEAGLSLAQVASGEISRTAVFLAETGKTRPTMPTIQLIAARTGKPVEYFLDPDGLAGLAQPLDVDKFRRLVVTERYDDLLAETEKAMAAAINPLDRAWAGFYFAMAQLHRANPYSAFPELTRARAAFEAAGDQWMVVECMDMESVGLHLVDDLKALPAAEAALDACRRLRPTNKALETRILGHLGSIHVAQHRWPKAVECYSQAVEVAGELRDLSRMGKMYNDLGIAYEHLGDLSRSRVYAQKAITIHELLHDRLAVARAENNLGLVFMRQGDLDEAREHLNRSLSIWREAGGEVGESHVLLSLAELDLNGGDPGGAGRRAKEALDIAQRQHEIGAVSEAHDILAQAAEVLNEPEVADQEFASSIAVLRSAGLDDRRVTSHVKYARLLEKRGDTERAFEQLKQAITASRPDLAVPADKTEQRAETA